MNTTQSPPRSQPPRLLLRRSDLTVHELDGEALVFDAASGDTHRLNSTALFIWNLCDGRQGIPQIAKRAAEVYDIALEPAMGYVERIVNDLDARHLFVESDNAAHGTAAP